MNIHKIFPRLQSSPNFQGIHYENRAAFDNMPEGIKRASKSDAQLLDKLATTDVFVKESGDIIVKDLVQEKTYVPTGKLNGYIPFAKSYPMQYELSNTSEPFEIVYPNYRRVDRAMDEHRQYGEEGYKYTSAMAIAKECHKNNAFEEYLETVIPRLSDINAKPFKGIRFQSLEAFHEIADNMETDKTKKFLDHIKKIEEYKTTAVYVEDSGDITVKDLSNDKTYEPTGEIKRHKEYTQNLSLYYGLKNVSEPFEISFMNPLSRLNYGMEEYQGKGTEFAAAFDIARAIELENTYAKYKGLSSEAWDAVEPNRKYDANELGYVFLDKFM